jgi:hypothetical protein
VKINGLTKKGFIRARKQKAYKSMGVEGEGPDLMEVEKTIGQRRSL